MSANLVHLANIEDEVDGTAAEIFGFTKVDGERDRVIVPRELADDVRHVRAELRKRNARLSLDRKESEEEVRRVINEPPRRLYLWSARTGWRDDNSAFVCRCETIDSHERRRRQIRPPRRLSDAQRMGATRSGTLDGWKRSVAHLCGFSNLGITVISVAFAAALLKIVGRPNFSINVFGRPETNESVRGRAKTGKSVMLLAGASVGGVGVEEEMPDWGATSAAKGELFRAHCDQLLPINETGLLSARAVSRKMTWTTYAVAQGRERERHSASSYATNDVSALFRGIAVFTSEYSSQEHAKRAGRDLDDGETARCVNIPAVRQGRATMFDRLPNHVATHRERAWARRALLRLRKACKEHHGVALPPFIPYLMEDLERAERAAKAYMDRFMDGLDTESMSEAEQHAAENFALIFAGGCLAIDAGILAYAKADLLRAVRRCFRDATRAASGEPDPLMQARRWLRSRLESDGVCELTGPKDRIDPSRFDGYVYEDAGQRKYVIHASAFRAWFASEPAAFEATLDWLARSGRLLPRRSHSIGVGQRPAGWAERVVEWPGGKATRSIVFLDPFAVSRKAETAKNIGSHRRFASPAVRPHNLGGGLARG